MPSGCDHGKFIIALLIFIFTGCNSNTKNEYLEANTNKVEMIDTTQKSEEIAYSNIQDFWVEFQKALKNKDTDKICQLTNFPYEVNIWNVDEGESIEYHDVKSFRGIVQNIYEFKDLYDRLLQYDAKNILNGGISINIDGVTFEYGISKVNGKYLLCSEYAFN
jgi:hypothetical protein